jgi:predicted ArsR family transcriptional regulator
MMIDEDARPGAERVLAAVRYASDGVAAGAGVTAAELAARLGLHVTTVRFHLERLAADGRVAGHAVASGGRGRPHVVYQEVRLPDARAGMLAALADAAAGEGPVGVRAQRAGEAWAETLDLGEEGVVDALTEVFAQLGFAPEPTEAGISLRACPFLDDARRHPEVVCGVHRGLAVGIARSAGASVELRPFQGDACLLDVNS